ncbi:MAG TPA: MASE1 domain-containing protein [Xanthobacteraceae bacterium]|jgi:signal transduction histidine kinase
MLQAAHKPPELPLPISAELSRRWVGAVGLAIAVGIFYFLAARLSLALITKPDGVAVFWPAAGVSSGVLIARGPSARWPVAAGAIGATLLAHLLAGDPLIWGAVVFALCNAGEALLAAWVIERYCGVDFELDTLGNVLGLLAAAIIGTAVSGIGGTVGYVLFQSSPASILTIWHHWFTSDALGIITVAPLLIGVAAAARDVPPRREVIEGVVALSVLAVLSGLIIFLPREVWATVVPLALLFPLLLWPAARCRPVFSAAAVFIVAITIVWTATFGIGIFGDANFPIAERVITAQAGILAVSFCALVLAALFSERRESEARLVHANTALQRERDNKLMNLEAMVASLSHEVRQPLVAISTNGGAARRFLRHTPPNIDEAQSSLNAIVNDSHRASAVFDNIRALFGSADQVREPTDVNRMILGALRALDGELTDHGVTSRAELTSELPFVMGHRGQLEEVLLNLGRNAIEAMDTIEVGSRALRVRTQHGDRDTIIVTVEDTGSGIAPEKLGIIFDAFVTTKPKGMGLGLAICRMIVERHGGQLSATSDGKSGASFEFVLPIKSAAGSSTASL